MGLLKALNLPPRPPRPGQPQAAATPVTLAIHKPDAPFETGTQQRLTVLAMMSDGKPQNYTTKATWSSSNDALVRMLPGGIAKVGRGSGRVTITAAAPDGKPRDSVDVKVRAKLQDIVITPKNPLVEVGKTEIMMATAVYADGSTEDLTPWLDWSADKPAVVEFPSNGGAWVAKGVGTATLAATDPRTRITGFGKVTVVAAGKGPKLVDIALEPLNPDIKHGQSVQFRATGIYADKSTHEITEKVRWKSSQPDVLVIDENTGLARPRLQSGNPLVSARDAATNIAKSTTVYVEFPGIVRIDVTPKDIRVGKGDVEMLTVMATLHGGWQMPVNDLVQWTPADTDVAVVEPGGARVIGVAPGRTQVEAYEASSKSTSTFHVTVLPPKMIDIVILPLGATIPVGRKLDFAASGQLDDLTLVPLDKPIWITSDRTIIDVDQKGVATAKAPGDVVIHVQDRTTGVMGRVAVTAVP
jgi:hypothetical protein